jgi:hypothetical protein
MDARLRPVALVCAAALLGSSGCKAEGASGPAPAAAVAPAPATTAAAPPATPSRPPRRGPLDAAALRCEHLLPGALGKELLGFAPDLLERRSREDGDIAIVCNHRARRLEESFSFQVACGRTALASFARIREVHARAGGVRPLPIGREGLLTQSSAVFVHGERPCMVQVAGRGASRAPGRLERLAAHLDASLP